MANWQPVGFWGSIVLYPSRPEPQEDPSVCPPTIRFSGWNFNVEGGLPGGNVKQDVPLAPAIDTLEEHRGSETWTEVSRNTQEPGNPQWPTGTRVLTSITFSRNRGGNVTLNLAFPYPILDSGIN